MTNPERRGRRLAALALLASAAPWFGAALGGSRVLYFRDLLQNLYPWRRFWVEEVRRGNWPLWDPYAAAGTPYLANPNTLSLYPLSWLQAVLPFHLAFNWVIIATWLLAQAGAYRLARRLGLARPPALLTALAYGGSGYLISALNLPNLLVAAAAIPWVCWASVGVARRAGGRDVACLAAALALCVLGGEPLALGVALAAAGLLILWPGGEGADPRRRLAGAVAGLVIGLLLAAPLLLPAAELVLHSERGAGLPQVERARWSVGALRAAEMVLPGLGGEPVWFDPGRYWSQAQHPGTMPLLLSLYAGVPLLALGAIGGLGLRPRTRIVVAGGILLCLGMAAGPNLPLFAALEALGAPSQWLRYPSKFVAGVFGPLAVLAGLGLQRLLRGETPSRLPAVASLCLAGGLALALLLDRLGEGWCEAWAGRAFVLAPAHAAAAATGVRRSLMVAMVLGGAVAALLGPLRRRLRPLATASVWILLVAGDLWAVQHRLVPRAAAQELELRTFFSEQLTPGVRLYRDERPPQFSFRAPTPERLWGFLLDRAMLARHTGSEARICTVLERPTDRLWPSESARLRRWAQESEPEARVHLLRRLGVEWWLTTASEVVPGVEQVGIVRGLTDPPLRLWRVLDPLPRVFWSDTFAVASGEEALRRGLTAAAGTDVWVGAMGGGPVSVSAPTGAGRGECRITREDADCIELRCEADGPGLAVVLDTLYRGWEVRVDGALMSPIQINGAYRGVELPAGRHHVVWRFRPFSVQLGRALGLAGVVILAVVWSRSARRKTKSVSRA
ncbi:MAG: hypothetical protein V3U98_09735 [Acidobacteriota bacterium]